jgi:type IV secretion system protein VirB8
MSGAVIESLAPRHRGDDESRLENLAWELDRVALTNRSERRAWRVAIGSAVVAVVAVAAVFVQGPLRRVEVVPLVVDRTTGETSIGSKLSVLTIPALDALDKHNADTFIRAREGYNWSFLQRDYDTVRRMSTPLVFAAYNKQFDPPDPLDKRLGRDGEQRITIVGIRLPAGGRKGNLGEAVVTFERDLRLPGKPPSVTRVVGSLRFEYQPTVLVKAEDQTANPFGFVVTAYRADEEFTAPTGAGGQ